MPNPFLLLASSGRRAIQSTGEKAQFEVLEEKV
jgi:hypothetical protein